MNAKGQADARWSLPVAPDRRGHDRSFQVPWRPVLATLLATLAVAYTLGARRQPLVDEPSPAAAFGVQLSPEGDQQQGAPGAAPSGRVAERRETVDPDALPLAAAAPQVAHEAPSPDTGGAPAMPVPPPSSLAPAPSPFAEAPTAADPGEVRQEMVAVSVDPTESIFDAPDAPVRASEPERQPAPPVAVPSLTSSAFDDEDVVDDHPVDDVGSITRSTFDEEDRIDRHPVP